MDLQRKLLKTRKIKKQYDAAMAQIITENGKLEDKARKLCCRALW